MPIMSFTNKLGKKDKIIKIWSSQGRTSSFKVELKADKKPNKMREQEEDQFKTSMTVEFKPTDATKSNKFKIFWEKAKRRGNFHRQCQVEIPVSAKTNWIYREVPQTVQTVPIVQTVHSTTQRTNQLRHDVIIISYLLNIWNLNSIMKGNQSK